MAYQTPLDFARQVAPVRHSDPSTSHDAAASVRNITKGQQWVLDTLLTLGPMHDEQLVHYMRDVHEYRISVSGVRTRRAELVAAGFVVDSGRRAVTESGRQSIVWRAV